MEKDKERDREKDRESETEVVNMIVDHATPSTPVSLDVDVS